MFAHPQSSRVSHPDSDSVHLLQLMADYNAWMNQQIYHSASELSAEQRDQDRGAFFGSITGTLNHLVVGDIIWLKRFAGYPPFAERLFALDNYAAPKSLDQIWHHDFASLRQTRVHLDQVITHWAQSLRAEDLAQAFEYTNSKGITSQRRLGHLILHFFNHQTHHRGQVTTLLQQAGRDVGMTDLLAKIPLIDP